MNSHSKTIFQIKLSCSPEPLANGTWTVNIQSRHVLSVTYELPFQSHLLDKTIVSVWSYIPWEWPFQDHFPNRTPLTWAQQWMCRISFPVSLMNGFFEDYVLSKTNVTHLLYNNEGVVAYTTSLTAWLQVCYCVKWVANELCYIWPWFMYTAGTPLAMVYSHYHKWLLVIITICICT